MILSLHQPAYLPWLGYFEKIQRSDVFIYLDTVQLGGKKDNFINRNKIKTPHGSQWLTIPVKAKLQANATILETEIDDEQPWRIKHLKSIELNYRKAPFFSEYFPRVEWLLSIPADNIAEFCWQHLKFWLAEFEVNTKVARLSDIGLTSKKSDLVLDICKYFSADHYLSGAMGREYLNEDDFSSAGISVEYQNFIHPTYPQKWGDFEPYMCIIDYLMNCGSIGLPFV
jgi:WbqC-like protein family